MIIKLATHKDIEALCDLRWEFVNGQKPTDKAEKDKFFAEFREYLEAVLNKTFVVMCAFDRDELIGNIYVGILFKPLVPNEKPHKIAYLTNVIVRSSHRERGIGKNLMQHLFGWANNNDIDSMFVWPRDGAHEFYEKMGFSDENNIMEIKS